MKLLNRDTDYAVRALLRVAGSGDAAGKTPVSRLAQELNVPYPFLRKVVRRLPRWLQPDPASSFSARSLTSVPLTGFSPGPALVTVVVNGIPSLSRVILVAPP